MAVNTKESGKATTWRASAITCGTMVVSTRDNTKMIKSTDSVFTHGLTAGATKATGGRANNMALEPTTSLRRARLSMASGKMASESNGLMRRMFQT